MMLLGIETSCDETAAAVFAGSNKGGCILAERLASQVQVHARFGGIVPEIASREHLRLLPPMVDEVMAEAETSWQDIDAIAVTAGPGLMGALLVGVCYARAAGLVNAIPVIPIHHMEGHLLAPGLTGDLPAFPFITLLASGGHTMLVRVNSVGDYHVIGQTLDDAVGECFDKCARLLGLPYPGGPAIAALAAGGEPERFKLPRPLLARDDLNFSFSGLKTAVMHVVRSNPELACDETMRRDLAAAVQSTIAEVLVTKAVSACHQQGIYELVAAGGVAANTLLRTTLQQTTAAHGIRLHVPSPCYCTDNAAMIAYAGWLHLHGGLPVPQSWDADPRRPLESSPDEAGLSL